MVETSNILMSVVRYLAEGYDYEYIEDVLGISGDGAIIGTIDTLRNCEYKTLVMTGKEPVALSHILNLYINGFTFEEIGLLTKYSKEGIRNRLISEINKGTRSLKECKGKNKEMRKSMRDSLFYEVYLRDLEVKGLDNVIKSSPYSESTFLKKMKELR